MLRIIEGAAAVFSLLLVLQAFWQFMRSPQWAAAAGSPSGIYIQELAPDRRLLNSWGPFVAPIDLDDSDVETQGEDHVLFIVGNVPGDGPADIRLNGSLLGLASIASDVRLRRGGNVLTVVRRNESPYRSLDSVSPWLYLNSHFRSLVQENVGLAVVRMRPRQPLEIKAFTLKRSFGCQVLGFAEPESKISIQEKPFGITEQLTTQASGVFMTNLFDDATRPLTLEFSYSNDRKAAPMGRLVIPRCSDALDSQIPLQRRLQIQRSEDEDEISFSGQVPAGTVLQEWVEKDQITAPEILWHLTGLALPVAPDSTNTITHTSDDNGVRLEFKLTVPANRQLFGESGQAVPLLLTKQDSLEVDDHFKPFSMRPPDQVSKGRKTWRGGNPSDPLFFSFMLVPASGGDTVSIPMEQGDTESESLAATEGLENPLHRFESHIPDFLKQILRALMTGLPFLWLFVLIRRMRRDSSCPFPRYGRILYGATVTFLLFHLTVLILPLFSFSLKFFNFNPFLTIGQWLASKGINAQAYINAFAMALSRLGAMYPFLMIGVSLLIRPLFKTYSSSTLATVEEGLSLRIFRWLLFWPMVLLLSLLSVVVITVHFASTMPALRQDDLMKAFLDHYLSIQFFYIAVAVAVFWLFFYWPLRVSLRLGMRIRPVLIATLAMLALPLAAPLLDLAIRIARHQIMVRYHYFASFVTVNLPHFLATGVVALIVAFLIDQIAYVAIYLARSGKGLRLIHSRWRWLALACYFLIALPLTGAVPPSPWFDDASLLRSLAIHVDDLLPYILAVGIVRFLQHINPKDSFVYPRNETPSIGALLFAFYLTGRTADILFIPLPVLLGWWLFRRLAIKVQDSAPPASTKTASSADVAALVEYRHTLPLVEGLRETVEGKLKKADISVTDYQTKMHEADGLLKEASDKLQDPEERVRDRIFGLGPESGPWKNGLMAMKAGIILSAPFQILNLLGNSKPTGDPYFQFQWFSSILFSFSFWTILAFLFGYFFHKLRGRDGLEKGLVFFLAVVLPTIPQRLLGGEPLFRTAHLAQIFEILAFMLALGLIAFDLRSLQRLHSRWNDLVAVHGLGRITGYASSVVITTVASLAAPALKTLLVGLLGKIGLKLPLG